jgi:hypothetical protein
MESKTSIRIHEEKLKTMELTSIPLLAVWNGYQRQFVVPLWPRFDELTKEEEIH